MNRLILVRHGNTFETGEPPRRIGARTDLPLTAAGEAQAAALAEVFTGRALLFDTILAGPLRRQRDTARLIVSAMGLGGAIAEAAFLNEIDHGPDEDRAEADVVARIGEDALRGWDGAGKAPPGWIVNADARIAGWRRLLSDPPPGDTLLVTSNGAARFVLAAEPALAQGLTSAKLRTGAYAELVRPAEGGWRRVGWDVRP